MIQQTNMLGQVQISDTESNLVTGVVTWLHLVPGVHLMVLLETTQQWAPVGSTTFVHFVHFPTFVQHTG